MSMAEVQKSLLTISLAPGQRTLLDRMAADRGWSVGQCVRFILAEKFTQLQQQEERSV